MKFGANTFIWADRWSNDLVPLLGKLKDGGFDGIEIPLIYPNQIKTDELRRNLEQHRLECTVCSVLPEGLNTISNDAEVRRKTREHLKACIKAVTAMGGSVMAGPLYAPVGFLPGHRRTNDEWRYAVECFRELGPVLEENGVTIAIEPLNRYETYFLNTAEDAAKLCREIDHPRVGILFDTYHANIEEKSVPEAITQAAPYLRHFHSCENDRGIPGTGHIDWPSVFGAIRSANYNGWLTIESFGFSLGSLSSAASIWRDLAPKAEDIAFSGVKFLRHQASA
ncbi:MAG: sugar phosphate isomerase/epimerase [Acidobacteriaceae bacterium]|nr:sugar phosphate isomerase/epimerase [Acidobacteriaceae bacterium]